MYDYPVPREELSSSTMIPKMTVVAGLTRGADELSLILDCETAMPISFPVSQHCRVKDRQRNAQHGRPGAEQELCLHVDAPPQNCLGLRTLHRSPSRVLSPELPAFRKSQQKRWEPCIVSWYFTLQQTLDCDDNSCWGDQRPRVVRTNEV